MEILVSFNRGYRRALVSLCTLEDFTTTIPDVKKYVKGDFLRVVSVGTWQRMTMPKRVELIYKAGKWYFAPVVL